MNVSFIILMNNAEGAEGQARDKPKGEEVNWSGILVKVGRIDGHERSSLKGSRSRAGATLV